MAYNSGFPVTYPQMYYTPQYQPVTQQQTQMNSNLIWVQGEAGAKSYLVAPNTTVQLWDSEAQTIYLKSADASGMPSMKIIDYTIRDLSPSKPSISAEKNTNTSTQEYATRAELEALTARLDALKTEISNSKRGVNADE